MKHPNEFIITDIETGGLDATTCAIVEIAFCIINWNLNDVSNYCKVIKPYNPNLEYNKAALEVNKLTMKEINNGEDSSVVVDELIDLMKQSKKRTGKKPVMAGHNLDKFDMPFIEVFFKFHKKDIWDYAECVTIDTMWLARWRHNESENFKLGTILGKENIYLSHSHTALGDAESTKELVKCFLKALRSEGQIISKQNKFRNTFQF